MLEKTIEVIDEIFEEVAEQYLYLKGKDSIEDLRLIQYVTFVNKVVNTFYANTTYTREVVIKSIELLHFELWENYLFPNGGLQGEDCKHILYQFEKRLFDSNVVYEKFWTDVDSLAQSSRHVVELLETLENSQTPLQKGAIWNIQGKNYIMGAPFALNTDIWLRSVDKINHPVQYLHRLSDFSSLTIDDFKLILIGSEVRV